MPNLKLTKITNQLGINKQLHFYLYAVYSVLIFILITFFFPRALAGNFNGLLFIADVNVLLCVISILTSFLCLYAVKKRYLNVTHTSSLIILLLIFLYFVPGLYINAAVNVSINYYFAYIVFFFMILLADMLLPYPKKKFQFLNRISGKNVRLLFLCLVVAVTILMLCLNKNYDVINGLISAIRNTYEVRAKAAGKIHWLFLGMEYWAAYYSIIMITFYLSKKRWFIVFLLMLIVLCFFTIQANRVMLFFLGIALIAGMMKKIDNRHIAGGLLIVSLLIFIEVLIAPDNGKIATSFFTRFSVIPNRLGENYYDYFLKNEPDYFRLHFPRLMKLMGLSSPYSNPSIGNLIGREFYSRTMNANTGLFGSAMLNFGVIGSLVEPILVVLLLRLIDKVTIGVGTYSMKLMISIVMTTLLINLPSALISAIMPVSYLCWLLMSLVLASRSDDVTSY